MRRHPLLLFLFFSILLSIAAFRGALWGSAMLAPLDLPAAAYPKYHFVDPQTTGVAANYGLNDQLIYDLPIQYTIHKAYRRGEIPWWDPYGFAGRPLLADAHINGTDPVRVAVYLLLPFELAYNWTQIIHFFLSGLGLFLLLRHWKFNPLVSVLLSLTYEFSGYFSHFFGYPWLQGSLVYYPFLWLVWDSASISKKWWHLPASALLVAAIFFSGNLQSHTYLVLFAAAFVLGYARTVKQWWQTLLPIVVGSSVLGGLLASPVLLNQVQFYVLGARAASPAMNPKAWLCGLASLSGVFPWALGAPGTLDIRAFLLRDIGLGQSYGLGFITYIGSAGFFLAILGGIKGADTSRSPIRRTAILLIVFVFAIISSPLISIFYTRSAGLAVMGLVVLTGLGCEFLATCAGNLRRWGLAIGALAVTIAITVNVGSLILYPRLENKIRDMLLKREATMEFRVGNPMRLQQVENFPQLVSFQNPAPLLAFVSLLALAGVLTNHRIRRQPFAVEAVLLFNFLPVFLLFLKLIPCHSVELWHRLLTGGPEQQRAISAVYKDRLRLIESAPSRNDPLFPDAFEHLYGVHTVHGYSALMPKSLETLPLRDREKYREQLADYSYTSIELDQPTGTLSKIAIPALARFQWQTNIVRTITVENETLNSIRLRVSPGPAATLLWTDTYYPGWKAKIDGQETPLVFVAPCFSQIAIPERADSITLEYTPSLLKYAAWLVALALVILGILISRNFRVTPSG